MLSRLIFGDDIFISYARADGSLYAVGLADELTKRSFSCFIDQLGAEPSERVPASLKSRLRGCTVMVLVGTPRALVSKQVRLEVEEFRRTGRPIIPVYFDTDDPAQTPLHSLVTGLAVTREAEEALKFGRPSEAVVSRIVNSFLYKRRTARLRRLTVGTVAFVVLLLGGAVALSNTIIQRANAARIEAEALRGEAEQQKEEAAKQEAAAKEANDKAQIALEAARRTKALADHNAAQVARCMAGK